MDYACPHARARQRLATEDGFTLVEVLVAILVLAAAVLGALALVNTANLTALSDKARSGGVNLARQIQEGARAAPATLPYGQMLNGCPAPSLATPCATTSSIVTTLQSQPGLAADAGSPSGVWQITRNGIAYTAKVSVCTMDDPSDGLGAHGGGFCTDNSTAGSADSDADDYKRVSIEVDWGQTRGANSVRAVALVNSNGV